MAKKVQEYKIILAAPGSYGDLLVSSTSLGYQHALDECDRLAAHTPANRTLKVLSDGVELYSRSGSNLKT